MKSLFQNEIRLCAVNRLARNMWTRPNRQCSFEVVAINRFMIFSLSVIMIFQKADHIIWQWQIVVVKTYGISMTVSDTYAPIWLTEHIMNQWTISLRQHNENSIFQLDDSGLCLSSATATVYGIIYFLCHIKTALTTIRFLVDALLHFFIYNYKLAANVNKNCIQCTWCASFWIKLPFNLN